MSTDARTLHHDAVVADTHNDLILLVDHFDQREQRTHFADFWLPELRAGGVDVQVLPICLEEQFQSEGGLRRGCWKLISADFADSEPTAD